MLKLILLIGIFLIGLVAPALNLFYAVLIKPRKLMRQYNISGYLECQTCGKITEYNCDDYLKLIRKPRNSKRVYRNGVLESQNITFNIACEICNQKTRQKVLFEKMDNSYRELATKEVRKAAIILFIAGFITAFLLGTIDKNF